MNDDELHDHDVPGLPPITETGDEFVCLPKAEVEQLRAIKARAEFLVRFWEFRNDATWDGMTSEEGYRAGQAFAARHILRVSPDARATGA